MSSQNLLGSQSKSEPIQDFVAVTQLPSIPPTVSRCTNIHNRRYGRFPDSHHLCSYAGLIPSTHSSGGITYHGSITKIGSKYSRSWILTMDKDGNGDKPRMGNYP
jgi:transposase